jgi:nucleotide sugar dehydrogenase
MHISIIGLGYVGLPLALLANSKGHSVKGVDKNSNLIELLKEGKTHLNDEIVSILLSESSMTFSTKITTADAYIVCVPTPVTKLNDPDLKYVIEAIEEIAEVIQDGQLVVVESTINPGVCEDVVAPILSNSRKKFLLAHCPERINPGDPKWNVSNIPRVVGGINDESGKRAVELYRSIIDAEITQVRQIKAAEATKILENTFRDVNIAFINEMAQSFHKLDIDIKEVIRGASTKPFAFLPHYPGIGVGGHCIAVDPYYMINKAKEAGFVHDFLIAARRINAEMPSFAISVLQDGLNDLGLPIKGTKITILGVSYKPNVADHRESPFFYVHEILKSKGAELTVFDPYLSQFSTVDTLDKALKKADAVVLVTAHKNFLSSNLYKGVKFVLDGRNVLNKDELRGYGVRVSGIGSK